MKSSECCLKTYSYNMQEWEALMQKRTSSTSTNSFGTSASTLLVPEKYPKIQKRTIKDIPFEAPQKKPRHSAMPAHMASVQDILTTWHGANHNRESSNVEMARQLVSKNAFRYSKVSHVCLWLFSCVLQSSSCKYSHNPMNLSDLVNIVCSKDICHI